MSKEPDTKKPTPKPVTAVNPKPVTTAKTQQENKNGITRPREGTATGTVWAAADEISAAKKRPAFRKEVLEACEKKGINPATATTQYGRWRRFQGLQGRGHPGEEQTPGKTNDGSNNKPKD